MSFVRNIHNFQFFVKHVSLAGLTMDLIKYSFCGTKLWNHTQDTQR